MKFHAEVRVADMNLNSRSRADESVFALRLAID